MTTAPPNPHPARLLGRLGVTEWPAAIAVVTVAGLQYLFLVKLWEGYPLLGMGDVIHPPLVAIGIIISLAGAGAIAGISLYRWSKSTEAARRLEQPATHQSFDCLRHDLARLTRRSTLLATPALVYTPKNAQALEVRESAAGQSIVVGLGLREDCAREGAALQAKLGHEVSHLELAGTRTEIFARRLVVLHFRVFGFLLAMFLLVLAFIDPLGLGSAPPLGGFMPVFDAGIYAGLIPQFAALVLSSAVVFVYSYFFLVRKEHIHDFRGSQLAGNDALAERVFARTGPIGLTSLRRAFSDFLGLHPTTAARRRVVRSRDFILLSAVFYPIIVAGIVPLGTLLTAGWRTALEVPEHWWNLGLTVLGGVLLFLVLRADIARLGVGLLLRRSLWLLLPVYALVAAFATQIPRIILESLFGVRRGMSVEEIADRLMNGVIMGGRSNVALVAGALILLAILAGIRIAATGEQQAGRWSIFDAGVTAFLVLAAFTVSSLTSAEFIVPVLMVSAGFAALHVAVFALGNRCSSCGRRRLGALAMRTRCRCGHETIADMRRWANDPYDRHLVLIVPDGPAKAWTPSNAANR